MIDPFIPLVVAVVLAVVLLVILATLVGHALWLGRRTARLAEPLAAARAATTRGIDGQGSAEDALRALARLPEREQIRVLADLAPALRGVQRERLEAIARDAGILRLADSWLNDRRWWRRLHGVRVHTLLGGSRGRVEEMLDDPVWEVRAEAAQWAADPPTRSVVDRLLQMLDDPDPLPRFAAKDALRRIGRGAAVPLAQALDTTSGRQAAEELEVAAMVVEPPMLPAALRLAEDEEAGTRARAAVLLGALGGEAAVERLVVLLDDREPAPRAAAAHALGRLGHWPAAAKLAACLRDPSWDVRRSSALALRELGGPGLLLLRRAVEGDDRFAGDIAKQVLDLPATAEEAVA